MSTEAKAKPDTVEVTLGVTGDDGSSKTETLSIPAGPTKTPVLKEELGIDSTASLWVIEKNGQKKLLGENQSDNVKAGDHFEALVKGGVS
jgi:hypothetical protein